MGCPKRVFRPFRGRFSRLQCASDPHPLSPSPSPSLARPCLRFAKRRLWAAWDASKAYWEHFGCEPANRPRGKEGVNTRISIRTYVRARWVLLACSRRRASNPEDHPIGTTLVCRTPIPPLITGFNCRSTATTCTSGGWTVLGKTRMMAGAAPFYRLPLSSVPQCQKMDVFGVARQTRTPLHETCQQECLWTPHMGVFEMHNARKCVFLVWQAERAYLCTKSSKLLRFRGL